MSSFSVVIPFKNRSVEVARRCLESLSKQHLDSLYNNEDNTENNDNYEVIFLDYGSDAAISKKVESICQNLSNVSYVHNETRGKLWSRSRSLNSGVLSSKGEYTIIGDVDMIYAPHFLNEVSKRARPDLMLHYQCYYLPPKFDFGTVQSYFDKPQNLEKYSKSSKESAMGIVVIPKNKLEQIGFYDEFFRMWGMEDKDLKRRLTQNGIQTEWLAPELAPVLHQWHPAANNPKAQPAAWMQIMIDHYHNKYDKPELNIQRKVNIGQIYKINERPALEYFLQYQDQLKADFEFEAPKERSFTHFASEFAKLQTNETLVVHQYFGLINEGKPVQTLAARVAKKANQILEKARLSYRFVDVKQYEIGLVDFYDVRDFLFYFLVDFEEAILDYYFDYVSDKDEQKITLILSKK